MTNRRIKMIAREMVEVLAGLRTVDQMNSSQNSLTTGGSQKHTISDFFARTPRRTNRSRMSRLTGRAGRWTRCPPRHHQAPRQCAAKSPQADGFAVNMPP